MKTRTEIPAQLTTTDKTNAFWAYVLFFLWPVIAMIRSLRNLDQPYSRAIITMFFGLFGYNLIFDMTDDSSRHEYEFMQIANQPFSEFFNIVSGLYSSEGVKLDFVMSLISFVVSRFTTNSAILFLVFGLVFGWIVMKNTKLLYANYLQRKNTIGLIFLIFFLVLLSPGRILSFRHYLALGVFILAVYQYFKNDDKFYLLLLASTVIIHFGFLMVVPLFFLYLLIGNRNVVYYILIVLSFGFADIAATLIGDYGVGTDTQLDSVVKGYTHQKYLADVSGLKQQRNVILNSYMRWTTLYFLGAMIFHKVKYKTFDPVSERLYSFSLLFFCFVNFTIGMEAISSRFGVVFQALCCYFFIHLYAQNNIKTNKVFKNVTIGLLALNVLIMTRLTIEFFNFNTVVPFLPLSLFVESDMSLLDVIK